MKNYRKLNCRLRRFAELIVEGKSQKDAALALRPQSSSPKQLGWKLRHLPVVAAAIEELEQQAIDDAGITRLSILRRLDKVADRCMQAEEVLDREGNATGEYRFDSTGANRSLELLGKYHKLFTDKVEATGKDGAPLIPGQAAKDTAQLMREANDPNVAAQAYADLMTGRTGTDKGS